jgi:hypothetical protein
MNAVIDTKTACTCYKKMLDITVQYLEMLWAKQRNTVSTVKDPPTRRILQLLQQGAYTCMQAASINTWPNTAQYHSGLALKLIVIFFSLSPSLNE